MTLKLALQFAEQSFAIFPMKLKWDPQQQRWIKNPLVKNDWQGRATTDPTRIKSSWDYWSRELAKEDGAELLPGLPLGRCGLVVVDCDRHADAPDGVVALLELGPLPEHPIITTRSGGQHHYYRQPANLISKTQSWRPGIDVIGAAGCVVGYAVPQEPIPVLPAAFLPFNHTHLGSPIPVLDVLEPGIGDGDPRVCERVVTEREANYAEQALSNAGFELRFTPVGARNSKLNILAYNMGRMVVRNWIARQQVEDCLLQACEKNGLLADDGEAQCLATIESGVRGGMARPYHDIF